MAAHSSSWFKGIKGKLLFAAMLPLLGFGGLFFASYNGLNKSAEIIATAHESLVPNLDSIGGIRNARNRFGFQALYAMTSTTNEERAAHIKEMTTGVEDFQKYYTAYQQAPFLPGEEATHENAKVHLNNTIAVMKEIAELVSSENPENMKKAKSLLDGKFAQEGSEAQKFLITVNRLYRDTAKAQAIEAASSRKATMTMVILVSLFASFLTFGILLWLAQRVSSSVGFVAERLSSAARNVASSVEQLNAAGNTLSSSSTEAAASLEETVASLEEMTSMVKLGSDNATQAASLASSSCQAAETGAHEIQNLIKSMNEISVSSKKIEEIISVIDDIAFQTNLLALNAAVEAARAGEQGKGFAVVAEAVRALAQRSASSAKDISSLIKESVDQIEHGSEIADKSGTMLSNILTSIKKVSDLNNEIAAASKEQATGIEQINKAMSQLDQAGQANAASAEEIAATSGEIGNLANTTQDITTELNQIVLGSGAQAEPQYEALSTAKPKKSALKPVSNKTPAAPPKSKPTPAQQIPFDDDSRGNIGDASGF